MSPAIEHDGLKGFRQSMQKIERLVQQVESIQDPKIRTAAIELVRTLMDLHGRGIERIVHIISDTGLPGDAIIDGFKDDELVSSLLLLYGLHPLPLEARVRQALDKVQPQLHSHGGSVELVGIEDGTVRLRLHGNCHGCASSAMTLKSAIEEAIYTFAPDLTMLEVEGVVESPASSGLIQLQKAPGKIDHRSPP